MRLVFLTLLTFSIILVHGQTKVSGKINGLTQPDTVEINQPFDAWYHKQNNLVLITDKAGRFSTTLSINKPQNLFFLHKGRKWLLYAEPGKDLHIIFDKSDPQKTLAFNGALKHENEFRKTSGITFSMSSKNRWLDTLRSPSQALETLKAYQVKSLRLLASQQETLSGAFNQITQKDLAYFPVASLWQIIQDRGIFIAGNSDTAGARAWTAALMDVHQWSGISDDKAVDSYFYQVMVAYYPTYLDYTATDKLSFQTLAEKIFEKPFPQVNEEVKRKGKRYWKYREINYGFSGTALQFAIASFIDNSINSGELSVVEEAYADFTSRFHGSVYTHHLDSITTPYFAKTAASSTGEIIFEPVNLHDSTLEVILRKHKGRVVFIDLWGTWCGPCRAEFAYNKDLKAYFKEKPVDFLYLAFERTNDPEKNWKETSRFYNLSGRHILATTTLEESIGKMYKKTGMSYPSYILVDKNGKIFTLFAERPSAKDALYKQIDQLLN